MFSFKKYSIFLTKSFVLSFSLILTACGAGGGGGTNYPSITYAGVTTAATVDETNAADFPVTMLEGSTNSDSANPYSAALDSNTTQSAQHAAMLDIVAEQIKSNIIHQQEISANGGIASRTTNTTNGTCPGNPGSITTIDNSSGTNVSGSYTYDNFCLGDFSGLGYEVTLYGKVSVSGSLASTSPVIFDTISLSVEYLKLTVRTATENFSEEFSGSISLTFDASNNITAMTVTTNFQANGLTYKVENLTVTKSGITMSISGRFYHPTHGYVDFTTTTDFTLFSSNPDKYCGGTMELEGSDGTPTGKTTIEFEANVDCTDYQVCVRPSTTTTSCLTGAWQPWP